MNERLRRWIRRGLVALLIVAAAGAALTWAAGRWVIPAYIRQVVSDRVGEVWDGAVTVRGVEFSYRGVVRLAAVRLTDEQGRPWLEAEGVRLRLRNWPGASPALGAVDVEALRVQVHGGPPVRRPPESGEPVALDAVAPESVHIRALSVTADGPGGWAALEPLAVAVVRHGERFDLWADSLPPHQGVLDVRASWDVAGRRVELDGRIDRRIEPHEAALLAAWIPGGAVVKEAQGRFVGEVAAAGDAGEAASFEVRATGELLGGSAVVAERVRVEGLDVDWRIADGQVELAEVSCRMLGGRLDGRARIGLVGPGVAVRADVAARGMDLVPLVHPGGDGVIRRAAFDGAIHVEPTADRAMEVHGRGSLLATTDAGPIEAVGGSVALAVEIPTTGPDAWRGRGEIALDNWQVAIADGEAAWIDVLADLDGRRLTLRQAEADVADGTIAATGALAFGGPQAEAAATFELDLTATDVRGDRLAAALGAGGGGELTLGLRAELSGSLGETLRLNAGGTASARTAGDRLAGGWELAVSRAGRGALDGRAALTDWVWGRGGGQLAHLRRAALWTGDGRRVGGEILMTAAGGTIEGQGRLDLTGRRKHRWELTCRDVDVATLLGLDGPDGPAVVVNLDGAVDAEGLSELTARLDGRADVDWPQRRLRAAAGLSLDAGLRDEPAASLLERLTVVAEMAGGHLDYDGQAVVTALDGAIHAAGGRRPWARAGAEAAGGRLLVDLWPAAEGDAYEGQIGVEGIDLARLPEGLVAAPWLDWTAIDGHLAVSGLGLETIALRGQATVAGRAAVLAGYDAAGRVALDCRVDGLGAAGPLEVHGTGRLSEWTVSTGSVPVAESFNVNARAFGRSVDIGGIHGRLLGGEAFGAFRVDLAPGRPVRTQGSMTVTDLALERLTAALGNPDADIAGRAEFAYRFAAEAVDLATVRGAGGLTIRDSRLLGVPVLTVIFDALGVRRASAADTDVWLAFTHAGAAVTLTDGRLATPLVALSPQPGGTVDLATGRVDVHVVAAALADIAAYLDFPILDLIVPVASRVTQVHVTGAWDRPESLRVEKEPLKDLGKATVKFFKGVVETGGELTEAFTEPAGQIAPW